MKTTLTAILICTIFSAFAQKDTLYVKDMFTPHAVTAKNVSGDRLTVIHDSNTVSVPLERVDSLKLQDGRLFKGDQLKNGMDFSPFHKPEITHKKGTFRFHIEKAGGLFVGAGIITLIGGVATPVMAVAGVNPYATLGVGIGTSALSTTLLVGGGVHLRNASMAKGANDLFVGIGSGGNGLGLTVGF